MIGSKSKNDKSVILDIVTVNDKGQVVIPHDTRVATDIQAGDKLLVMVHPSKSGVVLMKPDGLEQYATNVLAELQEIKIAKKRG